VTASRQETAQLRGEVQSQKADNATLRDNIATLGVERDQVRVPLMVILSGVQCAYVLA
jgi:septal ring factor EnvC (AmiA/AmiB activator)